MGGNALIPAPFIDINKQSISREDGLKLGQVYTITLRGKLSSWKGSPNSSGTFWTNSGYPPDENISQSSKFTSIMKKQEALRNLFNTDGQTFEVTGFDGYTTLSCNPRVKGIEFPDSEGKGANETELCEYIITLEADWVSGLAGNDIPANNSLISKYSEEWSIELLDEKFNTFRLTRSASATGRRVFDSNGGLLDGNESWVNAKNYILNVIGMGLNSQMMTASGVLDNNYGTLAAYNYYRGQHVNETAGIFSVTESWVCYDPKGGPPALSEQTVNIRTSAQDGSVTVGVEGNITGLVVRNNTTAVLASTRSTNALSLWSGNVFPALFTVASTAATSAGATLNPVPISATVAKNDTAGTINYNYEFNNRPVPITPGALSEHISVSNNAPADIFAQIPIPGRPIGPILQGMGTVTAKKRTINIEVQMPIPASQLAAAPSVSSIILALMPAAVNSPVFLEQDDDNWAVSTGRYTRNTTFVYE